MEAERRWQERWEKENVYRFDKNKLDKKLYVLEMFSYPSAAKLHVGHWYNYGPSDSYARFKRLQGYNVFQPMGFDAFGLPAENYAIKTGVHPEDSTLSNIETMEKQLREIGAMFDWDAEVKTCMPDYYRWTQWCFLELFKRGLAYRKEAPVNWCTSCNTVLANEQVIDGLCDRCHSQVIRKNLTQWFFKITHYAEELLADLDKLDWPEKTKAMQRNWIGKSIGAEITFELVGHDERITVFTTRPDTLFGCSYMVFSPEHSLVDTITTPEHRAEVEAYKEQAAKQSEIDRMSTVREKTGVFTGAYAVNPINGREVPIYVADYVLATYGTGIVMGVPAHDERDFEFATKYQLPIERVIRSTDPRIDDALPYHGDGVLVNSGPYDGLSVENGKDAIVAALQKDGLGRPHIQYRLRDWLISRQRYWGAPIPIVYCDKCGLVPVDEKDLPVLLPYDVDFTPDGTSPLLKSQSFMNATCPKCGAPAKRDADTMDTFMCSSWYFLRYPDAHNDNEAFSKVLIDRMLPVDKYIGGAEHACLHLLYARFFVKAFRDMGHLSFDEPFLSMVHQGVILGVDGNKMSKSLGNVVSPDEYISKYGSDIFRMYLMFGFSYIEGGIWSDDGLKAVLRFVERVERLVERIIKLRSQKSQGDADSDAALEYARHYAIKHITADNERFQFNTAIARAMELVNALYKYLDGPVNTQLAESITRDLLLLLAPYAPHRMEGLWEKMGYTFSIFQQKWPAFDESKLALDEVEIAIQVNGKVRTRITLPNGLSPDEIEKRVLAFEPLAQFIDGKTISKVIAVRNVVNIVAK